MNSLNILHDVEKLKKVLNAIQKPFIFKRIYIENSTYYLNLFFLQQNICLFLY